MNIPGCADNETGAKIAAAVGEVVFEVSRILPLTRLDGVTVAGDYASALRDLDRGLLSAPPLIPTNDGSGVGVAMAPTVLRENVVKVHVVLRGDFGLALISADDRARALALRRLPRSADDCHRSGTRDRPGGAACVPL